MKSIHWIISLLILFLLSACGTGPSDAEKSQRGYLDSAYVSKNFRQSMDSLQVNPSLESDDLKILQRFMRDFRDSIYGHPTYGELLDNAKALRDLRKSGMGMKVTSAKVRKEQKSTEIRFELGFENLLGQPVHRFSGDIVWKNQAGEIVCKSPAFTVDGPLEQGGKKEGLKFEYAFDKPMGNELNDPQKAAFRDTLDMMGKIAALNDPNMFQFRLTDAVLGNGLSLNQFYMRSPEDQKALEQKSFPKKVIQVADWANQNKQWIQWLQRTDGKYSLSIMPVLTEKSEYGHGPYLIFDRCEKVKAFFNVQKIIPGSHIKVMTTKMSGRQMVLNERVEFWNWPMEIRIFERH